MKPIQNGVSFNQHRELIGMKAFVIVAIYKISVMIRRSIPFLMTRVIVWQQQ